MQEHFEGWRNDIPRKKRQLLLLLPMHCLHWLSAWCRLAVVDLHQYHCLVDSPRNNPAFVIQSQFPIPKPIFEYLIHVSRFHTLVFLHSGCSRVQVNVAIQTVIDEWMKTRWKVHPSIHMQWVQNGHQSSTQDLAKSSTKIKYTVEPLHYEHPWANLKCPD